MIKTLFLHNLIIAPGMPDALFHPMQFLTNKGIDGPLSCPEGDVDSDLGLFVNLNRRSAPG